MHSYTYPASVRCFISDAWHDEHMPWVIWGILSSVKTTMMRIASSISSQVSPGQPAIRLRLKPLKLTVNLEVFIWQM